MANGPTIDSTGVHVDSTAYTIDGGGSATVPPTITTQPAAASTTSGSTVTFTVVATGSITGYQWYRNGVAISGAIAASYTTGILTTGDNGAVFYVVVSNNAANAVSNSAALTVTVGTPVILMQPVSTSVLVGQSATFTVGYSGSVTGFQWYKNGAAIPAATSLSYTTPPLALSDTGATFSVNLTNAGGTAVSNNATVTVSPAASAGMPSILVQPTSQRVLAGQTATYVVATAGSITSYQWLKNGLPIAGATSASYTTPAVSSADNNAGFSVIVIGPVGTATSGIGYLYVAAPTLSIANLIWDGQLPGILPTVTRSYVWGTAIKTALSGKETRIQLMQYPRIKFEMEYELLRDNIALSELRRLFGIFNAAAGNFGTFLFKDQTFNAVQEQVFGLGDGQTTAFQLVATFANNGEVGANEIIQNPQTTPAVYINGASTNAFTINTSGVVTFSTPPPINADLRWSGSFYYRVRFVDDTMDLTRFMANWWQSKTVQLISIKL